MIKYDLVVSIVTFNSPYNYLQNIIKAINKINYLKIFIIIVDNGSSKENYQKLIKLDAYVISAGKNLGYGKANNLAHELSPDSKYFLVLNPDIQIFDDSLMKLFNFLEKNSNYALLSPLLKSEDDKYYNIFRENFNFITLLKRRVIKTDDKIINKIFLKKIQKYGQVIDVNYISGSFMFFRRQVFHNIGGFNIKFFMYFEDVEICDLILKNDYKIGFLKDNESLHLRNRESYNKIKPMINHFISLLIYKLYNRAK